MSRPSEHPYLDIIIGNAERVEQLEAENARLRAAGDALHDAIRSHNLTEAHLKTWEEARNA